LTAAATAAAVAVEVEATHIICITNLWKLWA